MAIEGIRPIQSVTSKNLRVIKSSTDKKGTSNLSREDQSIQNKPISTPSVELLTNTDKPKDDECGPCVCSPTAPCSPCQPQDGCNPRVKPIGTPIESSRVELLTVQDKVGKKGKACRPAACTPVIACGPCQPECFPTSDDFSVGNSKECLPARCSPINPGTCNPQINGDQVS